MDPDFIRRLQEEHNRLQRLVEGPAMEILRAQEAQRRLLEQVGGSFAGIEASWDAARLASASIARWHEQLRADVSLAATSASRITKYMAADLHAATIQANAIAASIAAQDAIFRESALSVVSAFESIEWESLGGRMRLGLERQLLLTHSAARFSSAYARLVVPVAHAEKSPAPAPLARRVLNSPVGVLAHAQSLQIISQKKDARAIVLMVRSEIVEGTFDFVETELANVAPKCLSILRGARERAVQRGDDWVRHSASSYRQLLKNILHRAAPTLAVKPWATGKEDLDEKGFPRRRTKVRWLCRNVTSASMRQFLVEEIDSALKLIGVFDEAVHEDSFDICEEEFSVIAFRAEWALQALLKRWAAER